MIVFKIKHESMTDYIDEDGILDIKEYYELCDIGETISITKMDMTEEEYQKKIEELDNE